MRIACWQAESPAVGSASAMPDRIAAAAERAKVGGAELLITPEMSVTGYPVGDDHDEDTARRIDRMAGQVGIALAYGRPERVGDRVYNTASLVSADGQMLASYRKTHLYDTLDRASFVEGDEPVIQCRLGGMTVGVIICYDVEFPEMVRAHALAGTELLVVPTALMRPWEFVARTLIPARAFESQLFIAYVNWVGERKGVRYCGHTQVVDPSGRAVVASADTEELLVADIDPAELVRARADTPYLRDRRPPLYRALTVEP